MTLTAATYFCHDIYKAEGHCWWLGWQTALKHVLEACTSLQQGVPLISNVTQLASDMLQMHTPNQPGRNQPSFKQPPPCSSTGPPLCTRAAAVCVRETVTAVHHHHCCCSLSADSHAVTSSAAAPPASSHPAPWVTAGTAAAARQSPCHPGP